MTQTNRPGDPPRDRYEGAISLMLSFGRDKSDAGIISALNDLSDGEGLPRLTETEAVAMIDRARKLRAQS